MTRSAYHRTTEAAAEAILATGFRDATGTRMPGLNYTGVWVTWEQPWDLMLGGLAPDAEEALLAVELPETIFIEHEWVHGDLGFREALLPAAVLNQYPAWKAWECAECGHVERRPAHGWIAKPLVVGLHSVFVPVCPDCKDALPPRWSATRKFGPLLAGIEQLASRS